MRWSLSMPSMKEFWEMLPLLFNSGKFQEHFSSSTSLLCIINTSPSLRILHWTKNQQCNDEQKGEGSIQHPSQGGGREVWINRFYLQCTISNTFGCIKYLFPTSCTVHPPWDKMGYFHFFQNFTHSAWGVCSTKEVRIPGKYYFALYFQRGLWICKKDCYLSIFLSIHSAPPECKVL